MVPEYRGRLSSGGASRGDTKTSPRPSRSSRDSRDNRSPHRSPRPAAPEQIAKNAQLYAALKRQVRVRVRSVRVGATKSYTQSPLCLSVCLSVCLCAWEHLCHVTPFGMACGRNKIHLI